MIAITGGAGFIGSCLIAYLNSLGRKDILVIDHLGKSEKWRNLVKRDYAEYLTREEFREEIAKGRSDYPISSIVHLGACSSTTETDCDFLLDNNYRYSQEVCKFAIKNKIRLIVASSAATYGDGNLGFSEDLNLIPKFRPLNMYAYTKQLFDLWLIRNNFVDRVASLKFFNVFGPNEYHKGKMQSVVRKSYEEITRTLQANLFASSVRGIANGEQKRDFVYVKDVVRLLAYLIEHPNFNGIHNVGTGYATSFNELVRYVFAAVNFCHEGVEFPVRIKYVPMPETLARNYQNYTCAETGWLESLPGFYPFMSVKEAVADYVVNHLAAEDPWY